MKLYIFRFNFNLQRPMLLLVTLALLIALLLATAVDEVAIVQAGGVVGNGTPQSCTEATLNTALAAGGTVSFNCGTQPITITFTSRKTIAANTTIDGGGLITLDGGSKTALFSVQYLISFSVKNITLANARTTDKGAAIQNNQGPLSVTNSKFINNVSTTDAETYSGAIFAIGNTLTIANSSFSGNKGGDGGAIKNLQNNLIITNSIFTNNSSTYWGGAISVDGANNGTGAISITGSTFSGNTAYGFGGAIFNNLYQNDTFNIDKSIFTSNIVSARNGGGQGGAIFHIRTDPASPNPANTPVANLTIIDSTFSGNSSSSQGGALWAGKNQERISASIKNSTFSGNSTAVMGGGIWIATGGQTNIINTTIANNKAFSLNNGAPFGFGGGLAVDGSTPYTLNNITMAGNSAGFQGGGIWIAAATATNVTLQNSIIANNKADNAGNNWNVKKNCNLTMNNGGNNLQYQAGNTDAPDCASSISTADPKLDPLAYNRGPTQTMALLPGSAALNAGNNATCAATDQRGVSRPQGGNCDIGAFEVATTNFLTISSNVSDNGQGNPGTLSDMINQAAGNPAIQFIYINVASLTITGPLPTIPFGLTIAGLSCANPAVLNGLSSPANTIGLRLAGGVTLKNLTLQKFPGSELKAGNNGNQLICVKTKS